MFGLRYLVEHLKVSSYLPLYATAHSFLLSSLRMDRTPPLKMILGSSSVSRRKILGEMGYKFDIMTADIDEKCIRKESPEELVMALAEAKADAIMSKISAISTGDSAQTCLLTADTAEIVTQKLQIIDYVKDAEPTLLITGDQVVVYKGMIREKPTCRNEARRFIKDYSGSHAATVGSVLVTNLKTGFQKGKCDRAEIYFHEIPDTVIDTLIEEGIVLNVAGGLIIEHPQILPLVKDVVGAVDSVMGLPKALTEELIKEVLDQPQGTHSSLPPGF